MTEASAPVPYMERTRHYYRALGYASDYRWATFDDVPFASLARPLSDLRMALITTASPRDFDGIGRVWSGSVSPPPGKALHRQRGVGQGIDPHRRPGEFFADRGRFRIGY